MREELATEIGGPVADVVLFDLGTLYYLGRSELTLAFSLQHFGPEFKPSGTSGTTLHSRVPRTNIPR